MTIPFTLDYVIEKTRPAQPSRGRRVLKTFTGMEITSPGAGAIWPRLLEHKWPTSEKPRRDVGPRVAAVDLFENGDWLAA